MPKDNKDKKLGTRIWDGIGEGDFDSQKGVDEVDIAEYDKKNMTLFASNVNLWRQLLRLSDSLKPVERRILYQMYKYGCLPGHKMKSMLIMGYVTQIHAHGEAYSSMVSMAQNWKKQVPLVEGKGNFGNAANSSFYAASRYTEASMSKYAKECFFDDYDDDCVEMVFNSASDLYEPMSLPAKFPNILVNGGMGIAFGNAFRIPTYNIYDIIDVCKKVVANPETADVFMIPDLPSGCQVIDDGQCFHDIVDTGNGVLKMRADAEIIEGNRNWILKFTSIPWMVDLETIKKRVVELTKAGVLPIRDIQDHSYPINTKSGKIITMIDFRLIFDKAHDPQTILNKIYMNTDLQKSVSIDFKVVLDNLTIRRLSMRELIASWLDERRSYKRRLFNKRLTKVSARIALLKILLYLLQEDNIEKTIGIIKNSNSDEAISKLMKLGNMNSYQATRIYEMPLRAFTKDSRKKYKEELDQRKKERDELMNTIQSEKRIDKIILDELEDLRKYGQPRRSRIVQEDTGEHIADTNHSIIITHGNLLKKLGYPKDGIARNQSMGSFKTGDYPVLVQANIHNTSSITIFDTFGRYSTIPVHQIDNTELSHYGYKLYDVTKLTGKAVNCFESMDNDTLNLAKKRLGIPYLVTITRNGYAKKTPMDVFTGMKNNKNIRAMKIRDDDSLVVAQIMFDQTNIVIYTAKGDYLLLKVSDIGEQTKDSMGLITMRVNENDKIAGIGIVGDTDDYLFTLSEKGMAKKIPLKYLGSFGKRGASKCNGNLMTLDTTDKLVWVGGMRANQDAVVAMRNGIAALPFDTIPEANKKSKGKKLVSPGNNSNIITVSILDKR